VWVGLQPGISLSLQVGASFTQHCNVGFRTVDEVLRRSHLALLPTFRVSKSETIVLWELSRCGVQLPSDIKWHFIGHLQSNKAKPLRP